VESRPGGALIAACDARAFERSELLLELGMRAGRRAGEARFGEGGLRRVWRAEIHLRIVPSAPADSNSRWGLSRGPVAASRTFFGGHFGRTFERWFAGTSIKTVCYEARRLIEWE